MKLLPEFLNKANKNFYNKQSSSEYNSITPELQEMISQMYSDIPKYYYYTIDEMPNLSSYNVSYSKEEFENFERSFDENVSSLGNTIHR